MDTTDPAPQHRRRTPRMAPGLAALALAAGFATMTSAASAAPPSPSPRSTEAAVTAAARVPASHVITAQLTEFKITLSRSKLSAGTYTFRAVNVGHTEHALEINGPGVRDRRTPGVLSPGKSANLTVTLRAGRYDVFCPVGDHKELGMNLELTVTAATASAKAGSAATSSAANDY